MTTSSKWTNRLLNTAIKVTVILTILPGVLPEYAKANATPLSAKELKTEYRIQPVGIDVEAPRFSWIIQSDQRDTRQSAYRLQIAEAAPDFESGNRLIRDTENVESDKSIHKVYRGPELKAGQRYFWRVKVWDNHGRESAWSEPTFWETGLLNEDNWQAEWIEPDIEEDVSTSPPAPMLRREFQLEGDIERARAYVTSHGVYEMEINGMRVGDQVLSPGWTSYHNRLQYQTYDITDLLRSGENAVGVWLGDGWFRGYFGFRNERNNYGENLALLTQIEITYTDGRTEMVTTDEHWKATTGPIIRSDIYNGEFYDARKEMDGWSQADFDDGGWSGVRLADHGTHHLTGQEVQPARNIQELKPKEIFVTPEGDTVADMGQNLIGWIRLSVEGEAGTQVTLRHAETLDRYGNFYTTNLRLADQVNTYILRGDGTEVWEPRFTFQGFRYVSIEGFPGELTEDAITAVVLHSDLEPTGHFQSSNALINQLQHNILWSQKGNFLDIPTDCPQRNERLGWTGDIQVFVGTANFNMNTNAFLAKWLADLEADQMDDGRIPRTIPNVLALGRGDGAAGWSDAGVIVPWVLYQSFGDIRILETQYESMKAWVDFVDKRAAAKENRYLRIGDYTYGDWLSFNTTDSDYPGAFTDRDLISSAFFAYSSKLLSKTASVLGYEDDADYYSELFEKVREAFQREYVTPNGRVMSNTQTSYLLALRFGLLPEHNIADAVSHLAGRVEQKGHLTTGFLGTPHLAPVLSEHGRRDLAYYLMMREDYPSWLYPVTMGATTIWERWDGIRPDSTFQDEGMNSLNHYAYGAIGEWLFKEVAGIEEIKPGYKEIQIKPMPGGGLDHARALFHSPYGPVESSWEIDEDGFQLIVEIPANTSASIHLPHAQLNDVTENGRPLREADGIRDAQADGENVVLQAGSGRYTFSYPSATLTSELAEFSEESGDQHDRDSDQDEAVHPDAKIATLLADKAAREVLQNHLPNLFNSPWLSQVMGFSIETALATLPDSFGMSAQELDILKHELSEQSQK